MYVCMYVCMHVWMYVYMYVLDYSSMRKHTRKHPHTVTHTRTQAIAKTWKRVINYELTTIRRQHSMLSIFILATGERKYKLEDWRTAYAGIFISIDAHNLRLVWSEGLTPVGLLKCTFSKFLGCSMWLWSPAPNWYLHHRARESCRWDSIKIYYWSKYSLLPRWTQK